MIFESKESGREEGRIEGIEIEETQKSIAIAKNLITFGMPYFDDAVHQLYENGKIKTLKDGNHIRLELV